MQTNHILRRTDSVRELPTGALLEVEGYAAVEMGGLPGWLTGEDPKDQGVELTMPNLPDLDLPALDPIRVGLAVRFPTPETVRLTVAPLGSRAIEDDGTWLGIVTDPEPREVRPTVSVTDDAVRLDSGSVEVLVDRGSLAVTVTTADGVVLRTSDRLRQVAGLPMAPSVLVGDADLTLNLELAPDEEILGFGEQFGRLVKNGQLLTLRSEDALGTGTGMAYKPVPVWHSTKGYTGFLNTGAIVTADVGQRRPSVLGLGVAADALDLYVITGATPKRRLTAYTELTGRPPVPPAWAFGYWMGRCRYHTADEMLTVARRLHEVDVPIDVLHLDPHWLVVDRLNTDFIWNEERFGPRKDFVRALDDLGVRLSVWELPYLDPASPLYEEAKDRGYLVRTTSGELAEIQKTPTPDGRPRALIDFSYAEAREWWQEMHRPFLEDGVAVFKTDFGEALPDDAVFRDGTPDGQTHNLYPLRYNAAVSDGIARITGGTPLVWGRSGWAGSHRYPGQWGGDAESTVVGMQATVRGGLSYAMSAPGFWSHDIGGFFGPELTPELYVRWTQLGALSPLMRAHGLRPREPYEFGEEALELSRRWIKLRYRLLPQLWQAAHETASTGWPVLRPLALEFPEDPATAGIDDVFMLGSELLVVPIFDDGAKPVTRTFYLPSGDWVDILTGARFTGGGYRSVEVDLGSMPVLARAGSLIPVVDLEAGDTGTDDLLQRPWRMVRIGAEQGSRTERELVDFEGRTTVVSVGPDGLQSLGPLDVTLDESGQVHW